MWNILPAVLTWLVENAHEGKDYAVSDFLTTWQGADSSSTANDAKLASAATEDEDSFLRERFPDPTATQDTLSMFFAFCW